MDCVVAASPAPTAVPAAQVSSGNAAQPAPDVTATGFDDLLGRLMSPGIDTVDAVGGHRAKSRDRRRQPDSEEDDAPAAGGTADSGAVAWQAFASAPLALQPVREGQSTAADGNGSIAPEVPNVPGDVGAPPPAAAARVSLPEVGTRSAPEVAQSATGTTPVVVPQAPDDIHCPSGADPVTAGSAANSLADGAASPDNTATAPAPADAKAPDAGQHRSSSSAARSLMRALASLDASGAGAPAEARQASPDADSTTPQARVTGHGNVPEIAASKPGAATRQAAATPAAGVTTLEAIAVARPAEPSGGPGGKSADSSRQDAGRHESGDGATPASGITPEGEPHAPLPQLATEPLPRVLESAPAVPALRVTSPEEGIDTVPQIVSAMRTLVRDGGSEARIQLKPEHLGEMRIDIKIDGDRVSATLHVERADVRQAIEAQSHSLREGLASQGLELEDLTVGPYENGRDDRAEGDETRRQKEQPQPERRSRRRQPAREFDLDFES